MMNGDNVRERELYFGKCYGTVAAQELDSASHTSLVY